jgi:hypothetical protein
MVYSAALDLNPSVTAASLAGDWRQRGARLSLHRDGTYRCEGYSECNLFGAEGRWRLDDTYGLVFERADGRRATQNVVRYFGDLRLTDPIYDPDAWDGRLTFKHVDPPGQ